MSLTQGDRLGKYEIVASLGSGGMGEVYRALDPRLEREVAIKIIKPATSTAEGHARLWREARAAASISHPNVCQLYDVGEAGDQVFLVMELLTGESLGDRLRNGPLPIEQAISIVRAILAALTALHGRQIVHRDLKPSNVFLTHEGVKLLDFGLARSDTSVTGQDLTLTQTGMLVGTPRYMAPEQWSDATLDPRSDVFAVGALLFEMLSGTPAFPGDDIMQVYHSVMTAHPPALSGSSVVAAVDAVIHRALEKQAADRFPSASAMADALQTATSRPGSTSVVTVRRTTRLIAVPFRMLRPDPDVDFLTVSLPDAILGSLAGIQSLVVRSTLAGAGYTSEEGLNLKKIAAEAGVDVVLAGTLLRAGNQIRLNAQLLEAASGTMLWSKTVQMTLHDIFEVQDQLARAIVESLSIPLSSGEQPTRRDLPASARAYEFYLRGNQLAYDSSMLGVAGEMYRSALAEDPNFAPAWAKLGRVHRVLAKYGAEGTDDHLQKADEAFKRALEINPDLSVAHNLYTNLEVEVLGRATAAMTRLLKRARTQSPDPELYAGLVLACRFCGLLDASLAADRQARRLDPAIRTSVMHTHFALGDWERAIATDSDTLRWVTKWTLPLIGRTDEALASYRAVESLGLPPLIMRMMNGQRYVLEGRREEALVELQSARQTMDPEAAYAGARALARLGELDLALEVLTESVDRGYFCLASIDADPWLEPLSGHSQYTALREKAARGRDEAAQAFTRLGGEGVVGALD